MVKMKTKNVMPTSQDVQIFTNVKVEDSFEIPESKARNCPVCKK